LRARNLPVEDAALVADDALLTAGHQIVGAPPPPR